MNIIIEHRDRDFNVMLASKPDAEPFLTIRGCRVVNGKNGDFVSWPARKMDNGKYWNHVYASDAFVSAVLAEYNKAAKPRPAQKQRQAADDEIPF
jgi:DNA-binding cell septation regulator SpoVG